jgi:hypothetical protein
VSVTYTASGMVVPIPTSRPIRAARRVIAFQQAAQ